MEIGELSTNKLEPKHFINLPIDHAMPNNTKIEVDGLGCYVLTECKNAAASVHFESIGYYCKITADIFGTISKENAEKLVNKAIDVYFEEETK